MTSDNAALLSELTAGHQKLTGEWKRRDLPACAATLAKLRTQLASSAAEAAFLPVEALSERKKELLLARDVLEIGAQLSVATGDDAAFERYIAQLKTHYVDYADALPESAYQYELLGLNLMCLLSKNKIADFHTELEQLPPDALHSNPYIRCPVRMEQFIMEGSYNKVLAVRDSVPAESYRFFVDRLLGTIRDEIASCMERAYETIAAKECAKMLQLDAAAAGKYVSARGWVTTSDGRVVFGERRRRQEEEAVVGAGGDAHARAFQEEVPTEELAKMSITYAREMEQIV